jgi:hypothetical protein
MVRGERLAGTGSVPLRGCLGVGEDDQDDEEKADDETYHGDDVHLNSFGG